MVTIGNQTLQRHFSGLLASSAQRALPSAAPTASRLLYAAAKPVHVSSTPGGQVATGPFSYPSLGMFGTRNAGTLVGTALIRSRINAFSTDSTRTSEHGDSGIGEKLIAYRDMSYTLTQKGEHCIFSVLCGTSMYYELHIPLTSEEISKARSDTAFLDDFAGKVQHSPGTYLSRSITSF